MGPLISATELLDTLGEQTLLDVRWQLGRTDGADQHGQGHLPGAVYVDLETDLADPPGGGRGRHPLPDPARFAAAMRRYGVRLDRPVVVYDAVAGRSAARAWWLLRHHGHPDVRVLDGGWQAWLEVGGAVETGPVEPVPGDFEPRGPGLPVLDADGALRVARVGALVDARAPERYRGESEPVDPVAGHIPGAVNVPTDANLDDGARFLPAAELAATYADAIATGELVGVYCGSGVTATHGVLALEVAGVRAALYPGSWSAWVSDPGRPVSRAAGAEAPGAG